MNILFLSVRQTVLGHRHIISCPAILFLQAVATRVSFQEPVRETEMNENVNKKRHCNLIHI